MAEANTMWLRVDPGEDVTAEEVLDAMDDVPASIYVINYQSSADPHLSPERRAALFVLNDLKDKLAEMELHEDLPDSHDIGYMAAWREIRAWADAR